MSFRIFFYQPECKNRIGHAYSALKSLEWAIAPTSPWFIIHHKACTSLDLPEVRTLRLCDGRLSVADTRKGGAADQDLTMGSDLLAQSGDQLDFLSQLDLGPQDQIVFLSACAETAIVMLDALERRPMEMWPNCHFRFIGDERRLDLQDAAHQRLAAMLGRTGRIHLYAELTANICHVRHHYEGDPFELVKLPTKWPDEGPCELLAGRGNSFRIGIFGQPRRDKGKYRLGPVLSRFFGHMAADGKDGGIAVSIQQHHKSYRQLHLSALLATRLRGAFRRIEFLPPELSTEDFISEMRRCDVVLLPYELDGYVIRGSGIAVDAVAYGVPIICPKGSAIAELVALGNGLTAASDRDFAHALLAIAENREAFGASARLAGERAMLWGTNALFTALRTSRQAA